MNVDDREFLEAVEALRRLAQGGASTRVLLEYARETIATRSTPMLAITAFYRAFDISPNTAASLGSWTGLCGDNPGVSADELELELGDRLRSSVR